MCLIADTEDDTLWWDDGDSDDNKNDDDDIGDLELDDIMTPDDNSSDREVQYFFVWNFV